MNRRQVLYVLSTLTPLSGCTAVENDNATRADVNETSPEISKSPTSTPSLSSELLLPEPKNGWELKKTEIEGWRSMGGVDGAHGFYTSPDDIPFEVLVVEVNDDLDPVLIAQGWKCDSGWQVTLAYKGFVIASSSGTSQEPGTPDVPKMTRTPSPDTLDDARELLSLSPRLSRDEVLSREIEDC